MSLKTKPPKKFRSYSAKPLDVERKWYVVDATDRNIGRLAVKIANRLMGKDKPTFTKHVDTGDFVIVTNAEKVGIHPKKRENKEYRRWTGYLGGLRRETFEEVQAKDATRPIYSAVRRMLPKTNLGAAMLKKLKVYEGENHGHSAQQPEVWEPVPQVKS